MPSMSKQICMNSHNLCSIQFVSTATSIDHGKVLLCRVIELNFMGVTVVLCLLYLSTDFHSAIPLAKKVTPIKIDFESVFTE